LACGLAGGWVQARTRLVIALCFEFEDDNRKRAHCNAPFFKCPKTV